MRKRVFLSYCREASSHSAGRLKAELRDVDVFLDSAHIHSGDDFVARLLDALLQSHVIVIFAEPLYFLSPWCLEEAKIAGSALTHTSGESDLPLIVAMPPGVDRDTSSTLLANLPPALRLLNWPASDDTKALADLVNRVALRCNRTIAERLGDAARRLPSKLRERSRLLKAVSTTATQYVPQKSLGDQFVGRADALFELHQKLTLQMVTEGRARAVALCGIGGVGKTQLAFEYFRRFGPDQFPGGLFWINARGTEDEITTQFRELVKQTGGGEGKKGHLLRTRAEVWNALKRRLERLKPSTRALYVIDDVPEEMASESLTRWCPAPENLFLLITSRARLDHNPTLRIDTLNLEELQESDAVSMLSSAGVFGLREDDFRALVRWVGGLPLALDVLRKSLESKDNFPSTLRPLVNSSPASVLDSICDRLRALIPIRGPEAAYTASLMNLSPGARKLAGLIAQLAEAPIPVSLVLMLESDAGSGPGRSELCLRSFISECAPSQDVDFYGRMHPVLASFIREQTPPDALRSAEYALLNVMTEEACKTSARWPEMEACLPHAERVALADLQRKTEVTRDPVDALYQRVWTLLNAKGRVDEDPFGPLKEGQRLVTLLGENESFLTGCALMQMKMDRLGDLKIRLQDIELPVQDHVQRATDEAVPFARETVRIVKQHVAWRRKIRPDAGSTVKAMSDLAESYGSLGDHEAALQLQQDIFEVCYSKLGAVHPNTVVAAWNAWGTLSVLRRRPKQGKICDVLQAAAANHTHADSRVQEVGARYTFLGLPSDDLAIEELGFRRLMEPSEFIAQFGAVSCRFAELASGSGDPTRTLLDWLHQQCETYLGLAHPRTLEAINWLADYLLAIGEFPSARELQEQVFEVCLRNLGMTHRNTSVAAFNVLENAMLRERNAAIVPTVFQQGLEWLLAEPDDRLHPDQVTIRDALIAIVEIAQKDGGAT